ncbi:MAG: hypothetical protein V3S39_08600 [Thermodesulfobacteriota bacterium]
MKRFWVIALAAIFILGVGSYGLAHQFGGSWRGPGYGMMGGGMMGPGMMGSGSFGHMGPGMMRGLGGSAANLPCPGYGPHTEVTGQVTKEQAANWARNYLARLSNPNLKLGKITETETHFQAEILTKDNSLVEKILVEKATGRTTRAF